ncbi:hypothetical protein PV11_08603 [Exophiala sideris]|uniref:Uncharacterized protein n=1 Tax=Exophiala sideris TaxID=1016849 RepID=A0A0D1X122_9EURO|nr:hypothetical protein PV11_08603 [Exophiala sideris]
MSNICCSPTIVLPAPGCGPRNARSACRLSSSTTIVRPARSELGMITNLRVLIDVAPGHSSIRARSFLLVFFPTDVLSMAWRSYCCSTEPALCSSLGVEFSLGFLQLLMVFPHNICKPHLSSFIAFTFFHMLYTEFEQGRFFIREGIDPKVVAVTVTAQAAGMYQPIDRRQKRALRTGIALY